MKRYLRHYILEIEKKLKDGVPAAEQDEIRADIFAHISFFQHERLAHLLVLLTVCLLTVLLLLGALLLHSPLLLAAAALLIVLLISYLIHYYRLENGVQRLYALYDAVWRC